ncbi:MAG TPA: cytochrome c [Stellaceae bacterium]|nr:cytochrome c [Stellaceae bacterium]
MFLRKIALAKIALAAALALCAAAPARAQGLTPEDFKYLQATQGLTPQSPVIAELTPNEQQALHSAIFDLRTYPEGRDRQVRRYLTLVYGRECKRWVEAHPGGAPCSPAADPAVQPGKAISDKICAECHLFGTDRSPSYRHMAGEKDWNAHKVEHALRHSPSMVPLKLTPEMLDQLAAYINSFKK